jgi:GTPase SAR1 family protein
MFKVLIIGNSSVGKTSFLFRSVFRFLLLFIQDNTFQNDRYSDDMFTSAFVSTVGIDFKVKTVYKQDKRVKLQIWVSITSN